MPENAVETKKAPNLKANVVINLVRTLALTILSFLTFPYVTRALGDEVFGLYTWANAFVYYFIVLARISIPNIAIRECAKVKDDKEKFSNCVQKYFLIQAAMTLVSFGLLCSLVFAVPSLREHSALIFLLSINFLAGVFSFEWVYVALEKHVYITVRSVLLIAFSALLTFIFIKTMTRYQDSVGNWVYPAYDELYVYALIAILSTILTSVFNVLLLPKYVSFRKTMPWDFKSMLKPLVILALISFALTVYNQTDEFILGYIDPTKAAVGAYSVGVKGIDVIIILIISLYTVFMPRAAYYYSKENKYYYQNLINYSFSLTFFIAVPAIATMATMSRPITSLISGDGTEQYLNADLVLSLLCPMMLTYSLCDNIYTEIFIPQKKEKYYLISIGVGVILNIGLSLLFGIVGSKYFKIDSAVGIALGTMVADIVVLALCVIFSKKYALKAIFNLNNLKILLLGIAIGVLSYFVYPLFETYLPVEGKEAKMLLSLLLMVFADAIIYLGGLLLLRERLLSSALLKKKEEPHE